MSEHRPDPEALLARVKEEEARARRGKLKVFFGAAAGVGKTYAMLEAAREQRADGVDVVVGYVETHKRAETEALLEGLEVLPRRAVDYRGTSLEEFDLDAAIARRPAIILVDELAHTNTPGCRHAKRWQDVVELLDAGIDVYTTVNVQHIESLNDVVAKVTGVVMRETVPDSVFDQADEVELIDLPPDDLLDRFREGKVYVPGLAQEGLENFFRKGNLIALRELALRRTAERVDAQMRVYRREHAIASVWPTTERILVCVAPTPWSARLVRAAKRMADQMGAEWIAAYVETPASLRLPAEAKDSVIQTLRLAESLGGQTITLSGQTMSEAILAYGRDRNVTRIVVGKPRRKLWQRIVMGSIVDALVQGSGDIDVQVISGARVEGVAPPPIRRRRPLATDWRAYAWAAGVVAVATGVAWLLFPFSELSNVVMLYLLAIVVVAMRAGRAPSLAASGLSVAAFDFFFVPPYLTFAVTDVRYVFTFMVMLAVGVVISGLTARTRAQAEAAQHREQQMATLYAMSRELSSTRGVDNLLQIAVRHVGDVFRGQIAVLVPETSGRLEAWRGGQFDVDGNDLGVGRWVYEHRQPAGLGTTTLPGASALYVPLIGSAGPVGVLGIRPADRHAMDEPELLHRFETFAGQIALALERARLAEEAQQAELRIESERLRNSLLSSVSHDLRTPLAAITGASSAILESGKPLDATQRELLESVREEAERLNRLVHNLLEMTRLESGALQVRRELHPPEEIIGAALGRLAKRLAGRRVSTRVPLDLPLVPMDDILIEQVLVNLLDNALKYTPAGSPIEVIATATEQNVTIEVADHGPGLPTGEEEKVFEKFHRGDQIATSRGAGLGLAICLGIVRAHGGRIWAHNLPGGGVAFLFTLPVGEPKKSTGS